MKMLKNLKRLFILTLFIIVVWLLSSGCQLSFPSTTIYVGKDCDYATIQEAIDNSTFSGQYIVVLSGTYVEDLNISKSVCIIGKSDSVTIKGGCKILSDGIRLEKLVFDGETTGSVNCLEPDVTKDINGLTIDNCTFKNFAGTALNLFSGEDSPKSVNSVSIKESRFIKNGENGLMLANCSGVNIIKCYFEENGGFSDGDTEGYAVNIALENGDYSGISIIDSEFVSNGSSSSTSGGALVCSTDGSYDGEVIIENCLFVSNVNDIVQGRKNTPASKIDVQVINGRGYSPKIIDLTSL